MRRRKTGLLFLAAALLRAEDVATFSIVAWDEAAGEWGVAVASKYFSVGSVVPWAEAGVGAIATQANVNVGYGPRGLELLRQGLTARQTLDRLLAEDKFEGKEGRQLAIVDRHGGIAAYTGPKANAWAGDRQGKTWSAQGNILTGAAVVESMGKAFESTRGDLAERLYAALKAGDGEGGDSRGRQSASILVVRKGGGRNINNDRPVYINVDDNADPFSELRRLLTLNQRALYMDRAYKRRTSGDQEGARKAQAIAALYAYMAGDREAALRLLEGGRTLLEQLVQSHSVFAPLARLVSGKPVR